MSLADVYKLENGLKEILNITDNVTKNSKLLDFLDKNKDLMNQKTKDGRTFIHSMARAIKDPTKKITINIDNTAIETECNNFEERIAMVFTRETAYKLKIFLISKDADEDVKDKFRELFEKTYIEANTKKGVTPQMLAINCNKEFDEFMSDNNGVNGNNNTNDNNNDDNNNNNNDDDDDGDNNNKREFTNFKELYEYYKTNLKTNLTFLDEPIIFKVLGKEDNGGNILKISSSDISLYSNEKNLSNETTLRIEENEKPVYTASNFKAIMEAIMKKNSNELNFENSNELNFENSNFIIIKCQCLEDDIEVTSYANGTAKHAGYETTAYKKTCDRIIIQCDKNDGFKFYYYVDTNGNKRDIKLELVDQENLNREQNGGKRNHKTRKSKKSLKSIKTKKSHKSRKSRKSKKHRRSHRR